MLTIRAEQLAVFEKSSSPEFALRMEEHVREAFPKHSGFLGDAGVREIVRYGVEQGRASGFSTQSPVRLFIDLTLLLGREFHSDPQLPWAREVIEDHALFPDELSRAERLHAANCVWAGFPSLVAAASGRMARGPSSAARGQAPSSISHRHSATTPRRGDNPQVAGLAGAFD